MNKGWLDDASILAETLQILEYVLLHIDQDPTCIFGGIEDAARSFTIQAGILLSALINLTLLSHYCEDWAKVCGLGFPKLTFDILQISVLFVGLPTGLRLDVVVH